MAASSGIERRAARRSRNQTLVDLNLVSLIDVFTILIFFLLSSSGGVETLVSPKAVQLPLAHAEQAPKPTVVVVVAGDEILVDGRRVARVADALGAADDRVPALRAELDVLAARAPLRAGNAGAGRAVTLMADKDIPYRLLRKLLATCADAGFVDVAFAVRKKEGGA
ncbi:MAG: biopolymer transporter ExbD [Burkholderiales bacterium]|nr:biopolymer transporter ExbD [Burkholderiales bacterium]